MTTPLSHELSPPLGRGGLSHRRPSAFDRFHYGVCYYPEHWDADTRARDADRMAAAGMNVVRMGEFAWSVMEPTPGSYDFSLFDETLKLLSRVGISAILCTPTATPPRRLLNEFPDMVRTNATGLAFVHGSRQHASHFHEGFRRESRRITRAMAEHFDGHESVVGWQTDNEFHCGFSEDYSAAAANAFCRWCERTYGDIDTLNRTWGTAFWSQQFDTFDDVTLPKPDAPTYPNPAHAAAYFRFLSDGVSRFQRDQVEILREINPSWWITHNGVFGHLDYRGPFTADLDVLGFDTYPMFSGPDGRAAGHAFNIDRVRASSGNFIVLEHQAGAGGQNDYMLEQPLPGEMRQQCYRSIARGADSLLFFRWRTCRFGAEQAWLGLIDHDNVGRRRFEEATTLGGELQRVGPAVLDTSVAIDAAVASAGTAATDAYLAYTLGLPSPDNMAETTHAAMLRLGLTPGCVHPADDLTGVGLYVLPHWTTFDPAWVEPLRTWVEQGGTLVVGARTASRDVDNNLTGASRPGVLSDLCGMTVSEYGRLNTGGRGMTIRVGDTPVAAEHWYELLQPTTADVVATWLGGPFAGQAAVTRHTVGQGRVVYVGTYLTADVADALLPAMASSVERLRPDRLDARVGYTRRVGQGGRVLHFFLNEGIDAVDVDLPPGRELTRDIDAGQRCTLEAFGVAIVSATA